MSDTCCHRPTGAERERDEARARLELGRAENHCYRDALEEAHREHESCQAIFDAATANIDDLKACLRVAEARYTELKAAVKDKAETWIGQCGRDAGFDSGLIYAGEELYILIERAEKDAG